MRAFIVVAALAFLAATPADLPPEKPVEQTKKNIKVLQGLPSSQLIPAMAFMANSLGVTCAHCHGKEWESDEKPAKDAARKMIALQRSINEQHYGGKAVVTCNTCHQGHVITAPTPDIANAGWNTRPAAPPPPDFLSGEDVLTRLPPSTGTARIIRGTVERFSGRDAPKSAPFTLTIDGASIKYDTELSHPPEAKRALMLYAVERPNADQLRGERWTIAPDAIRRNRQTQTPFGILPEAIDWSDFRDTPAGRLPFRAQWSRADYRVTYSIDEIR